MVEIKNQTPVEDSANPRIPSSINKTRLITAVVVIGILTGVGTFLMKRGIKLIGILVTDFMNSNSFNWLFLLLPLIGFLLAYIFQRYILKENLSESTPSIKKDVNTNQCKLRISDMFTSIIGCALTLGMGGSAGAEGPSAYTGAAVGSNLSRWLKLDDRWIRILFSIGAGAGIAGIFKSPIGGVLFTLEVIGMEISTLPVLLLVACCLLASSTAWALGGFDFDIVFNNHMPFEPKDVLWMAALGTFCGIYCIYYNYTKNKTGYFLKIIKNPWVKTLVAALMVGIGIFFFPALFGEGYETIGNIINSRDPGFMAYGVFHGWALNHTSLLVAAIFILLLKGSLVSATLHGGGVAGDFTPTLFAGCVAGYLFGNLINLWFHAGVPPENFALLGMAAVMSGAIGAPLMSIFIVAEMSNSYQFMFGFLLVSFISYFLSRIISSRIMKDDSKSVYQSYNL